MILNLLVGLARRTIARYQPKVIGITGSVGKTTAKEAIYTALKGSFRVAKSLKNANTEWGIVATVIWPGLSLAQTADGRAYITPMQFAKLIWRGLVGHANYPEILVLELAADRPGDIKFFNRWLQYDIAVITNIGSVHLEFYPDQAALTAEKLSIAAGLKPTGQLVLNGDNELLNDFITTTELKFTTFGWDETNHYNIHLRDVNMDGLRYEINTPAGVVELTLGFGRQLASAIAAAIAVGQALGIAVEQLSQRLTDFAGLSGRFEIAQLRRGITLINDAYNANPDSMQSAITSLQDIASVAGGQSPAKLQRRRVAILGGMRELGIAHESAHRELGRFVRDKVDLLVVVGADGGLIADAANAAGLSEAQIVRVPSIEQVDFSTFLRDNDAVLVKASRYFELDQVVAQIKRRIGQ